MKASLSPLPQVIVCLNEDKFNRLPRWLCQGSFLIRKRRVGGKKKQKKTQHLIFFFTFHAAKTSLFIPPPAQHGVLSLTPHPLTWLIPQRRCFTAVAHSSVFVRHVNILFVFFAHALTECAANRAHRPRIWHAKLMLSSTKKKCIYLTCVREAKCLDKTSGTMALEAPQSILWYCDSFYIFFWKEV